MADAEHSKCFARKGVWVQVPPPALCDLSRDRRQAGPIFWVRLVSFLGSGGLFAGSGWLVVAGRAAGEFPQDLSGDRADDADVEVLADQDDVGSGVGSADGRGPGLRILVHRRGVCLATRG